MCCIPFETVDEYLSLLRLVGEKLSVLDHKACFFLASAVSDFYIPFEEVSDNTLIADQIIKSTDAGAQDSISQWRHES